MFEDLIHKINNGVSIGSLTKKINETYMKQKEKKKKPTNICYHKKLKIFNFSYYSWLIKQVRSITLSFLLSSLLEQNS